MYRLWKHKRQTYVVGPFVPFRWKPTTGIAGAWGYGLLRLCSGNSRRLFRTRELLRSPALTYSQTHYILSLPIILSMRILSNSPSPVNPLNPDQVRGSHQSLEGVTKDSISGFARPSKERSFFHAFQISRVPGDGTLCASTGIKDSIKRIREV
jgi:hypothetical protein